MSTLLIVDDDKSTRDGLNLALSADYDVLTAADADAAMEAMNTHAVDLVLTDLRMPGRDGMSLLRDIIIASPDTPVILLSAYGSVERAVEAMKYGAYDFLTKPVNLDHLEIVVRRALRSHAADSVAPQLRSRVAGEQALARMIGESAAMKQIRERIAQVAPTPATVLIQGPSGTGKELVARAVHALSPRADGPFVAVHCAALSSTLLESELFGHVRGAFTGATEDRKGRFELADGGTLFLDEISEIDPATQVKLLRVLETRTVEPVGSAEARPVNIRLVAATNRNLREWTKEGHFREDLFFRLNVVDISLPPLRKRPGDLALLCDSFVRTFNPALGRHILGFTPDALAILGRYPWPGNVRELRNTVERMMVLAPGDRLTADDVPENIRDAACAPAAEEDPEPALPVPLSAEEEDEAHRIRNALAETGNNKTAAAKRLGMPLRTLYRRIKSYRLDV